MARRRRRQKIPMLGAKFGALTVLANIGIGQRGYIRWRCQCSCGEVVEADGDRLRSGDRKACGLNGHFYARQAVRYRRADWKVEYEAWGNMRSRCNNPKHERYKDYGGRGITICDRWNKFENFADDLGPRPSADHSLDRIDPNGNYTPENCKWSTPPEQGRNRRRTVFVDYKGKREKMADLIAQSGLKDSVVWHRVRYGWPLEIALTTPVDGPRPRRRVFTPMYMLNLGEEILEP